MKNRQESADQLFISTCIAFLGALAWFRAKDVIIQFMIRYRVAFSAVLAVLIVFLYSWARRRYLQSCRKVDLEESILSGEGDDSVFAGIARSGRRVHIKRSYRRMHTQVVGTTNAGKTESVILPWAIDDIKKGRGLIIIDGKSDRSLLNKLYAYAKRYKREEDFRILSLCEVEISNTFNPFSAGTPLEITERVFKALSFENEYFKSLQYEALLQTLLIFESAKLTATPIRVVEALRSPARLKEIAAEAGRQQLDWIRDFLSLSREEREQRTSGLVTQLQVFAVGATACVFNSENSDIQMERVLEESLIVYCQLPVLKVPTLGKVTGKLILQCLQSAVSSRHMSTSGVGEFFTVYLDDFTEYLTESFVSLLNKSRSANVAVVFAHQALGDLAILGDAVKNTILTNANLKVFMRTNEPESAEYFSGVVGTAQTAKLTERQTKGFFGAVRTGDGSVRDAEEYRFHPNLFKQDLGVGEAVMVIPHEAGSLPVRLKFRKSPDLDPIDIPIVVKGAPNGLPLGVRETEKRRSDKFGHMDKGKERKTREEAA